MSERYAYDVATMDVDGDWTVDLSGQDVFSRDPASTARSLLERWIHDNCRQLTGGGRVLVFAGSKAARSGHLDGLAPNVRVRVFRTHNGNPHTRSLAAIAYLARVERDDDSTGRRNGLVDRWRLRWEYRRYVASFLTPHRPADSPPAETRRAALVRG